MIIAIANAKSSGKSIIALNLLKRMRFDIVIDADPHRGLSDFAEIAEPGEEFDVTHVSHAKDLVGLLQKHDKVLIDCGGFDNQLTRTAILNADFIITPSNEHAAEQLRLARFAGVLGEIGKDVVAHVLVNKVHHSRRHFHAIAGLVAQHNNLELLPTDFALPALETVDEAASRGRATRDSVHAERFDMFVQYLKERLEP